MNATSTSRIYVACLASYNNGRLHGAWIDATDADTMREEIAKILRASPYPNVTVQCPDCGNGTKVIGHNSETGDTRMATCETCKGSGEVPSAEEWAVHDYEGFAGIKLGENPDLDEVADLAALLEEHQEDLIRAASDATSETTAEALRSVIEDRFQGAFDSAADFAADLIENCYDLKDVPDIVKNHINFDGIARDLHMCGDYDYCHINHTVYVFRNE